VAAETAERVLLFTLPDDTDRAHLTGVLTEAGLECAVIEGVDALFDALREGAGVIVTSAEAITEHTVRILAKTLARRPPWSNLPIIILVDSNRAAIERLDALDLFSPSTSSNVTVIERPVHDVTLLTMVRAALRARRRQYEVRDLLRHLEHTNEELRASQEALQSVNDTLEARVEERTRQVRELALALTTAEQQERMRISQILHDHLQQLIHGAKMWAETGRDEPDTAPPETLDRIIDLLDDALDTTRSLTVDLSPPVLRSDGLVAAFHWLADHVADTHGLHVLLDLDDDLVIPQDDLRTLLFDVTRELLFNVVKHADTRTATLSAQAVGRDAEAASGLLSEADAGEAVVLEVADEGSGFDPSTISEASDPDGGFGLYSVRERIDLIGGRVAIDSAPGQGTRVQVAVPLPADEDAVSSSIPEAETPA
jgi:signal transduction histidine kinase